METAPSGDRSPLGAACCYSPSRTSKIRWATRPHLIQQPAERGERVVRFGLEPARDVAARRRTVFEQQVRQEA
jgi:hypothetical protein